MKLSTVFVSLVLAAATAFAEVDIPSLVDQVKGDPQRAPGLVAAAAVKAPSEAARIVEAMAKAFPEKALEIAEAVLKVLPKQAPETVAAAIRAVPAVAEKLVPAAVEQLPELAADIRKAADEARSIETAVARPEQPGRAERGPAFPAQPIRADLVSPSR